MFQIEQINPDTLTHSEGAFIHQFKSYEFWGWMPIDISRRSHNRWWAHVRLNCDPNILSILKALYKKYPLASEILVLPKIRHNRAPYWPSEGFKPICNQYTFYVHWSHSEASPSLV